MTLMKQLGLVTLVLTSLSVNAAEDRTCSFLDDEQKYVVTRAYEIGADVGYADTLAAIALTESEAGKNLVNARSGDYGVFQNNIKYTVRRIEQITGAPMSRKQISGLKKTLVSDMEESATYSIMELNYWAKRHNNNWRKTIASYNEGHDWNSRKAQKYVARVSRNMQKLKSCNCIPRR